jgi:hypothetical protein
VHHAVAIHVLDGDLLPIHVQATYDRHRDFLEPSWLQLTVPRIVLYKPALGYYLGKKTLVEAKKLGDVPESGASSRLATEFQRDVVRR